MDMPVNNKPTLIQIILNIKHNVHYNQQRSNYADNLSFSKLKLTLVHGEQIIAKCVIIPCTNHFKQWI